MTTRCRLCTFSQWHRSLLRHLKCRLDLQCPYSYMWWEVSIGPLPGDRGRGMLAGKLVGMPESESLTAVKYHRPQISWR